MKKDSFLSNNLQANLNIIIIIINIIITVQYKSENWKPYLPQFIFNHHPPREQIYSNLREMLQTLLPSQLRLQSSELILQIF